MPGQAPQCCTADLVFPMWIPKPLYEALPYILVAGGVIVAVTVFVSGAGWLQNSILIAATIVAVAGLVLLLKRRDYRQSRSRIKYDRLD